MRNGNMKMIDMHCDTILQCYKYKTPLFDGPTQVTVEKLKRGGSLAQCFAIFIPCYDAAERYGFTITPYEIYHEVKNLFKSEMEKNKEHIRQVYTAQDISDNAKNGLLSAILTIEDSVPVDGKPERLDEFFEDGVRMMSLTWNYENCIGYPNSKDAALHAKGLKPFGIEAVERMNELGIIVDVSHLSEGGFDDVARISKKPFIASHSCARSIGSHQRNLTDRQLKVLGDKGGIVGVNFCAQFLEDDATFSSIENIVKHLVYMKDKAGIDALAFGSDFDGIDGSVLEYKDFAGFPLIVDALAGKFTDDEIDKICNGNFLRVFRENING